MSKPAWKIYTCIQCIDVCGCVPWPNPPQFFSWIRSGLPQQSRAELITHVRQWPVCSCCIVATVLLRSSWFPWTIVEFSPARKWWFGKEISFQTPCGFIFRFHNYAGIQWFCSHPEIPHIFTWRFLSWTVAEAHQCFLQNIIVCIFLQLRELIHSASATAPREKQQGIMLSSW